MTAVPAGWVRRYLRLLQVEHRPASLESLARLTRAQLLTVPFENVTALLRARAHAGASPPPLDPEALLEGWEEGRGGGVCFELAPLFGRLLAALGYRVRPVLGAISFPGSHQALVVELGEVRLLVDVANGAPILEPVPLDRTVEIRRGGLGYRFRPGERDGEWMQERLIEGAWQPFCRYALGGCEPEEQEAAYRRHHLPGESWVTGSLRLIRCEEDRVLSLHDDELVHFTPAGKRAERVEGAARYRQLAAELFRLPGLPIVEGLRARSELAGHPGFPVPPRPCDP